MTNRLIRYSTAVVVLLAGLTFQDCSASAGDIFPDENLEAAIKDVLRRQGKEEINSKKATVQAVVVKCQNSNDRQGSQPVKPGQMRASRSGLIHGVNGTRYGQYSRI